MYYNGIKQHKQRSTLCTSTLIKYSSNFGFIGHLLGYHWILQQEDAQVYDRFC